MADAQIENDSAPSSNQESDARFFGRAGRIAMSFLGIIVLGEVITRSLDYAINDVPIIGLDESATLYQEHPFIYKVPIPNANASKDEPP